MPLIFHHATGIFKDLGVCQKVMDHYLVAKWLVEICCPWFFWVKRFVMHDWSL